MEQAGAAKAKAVRCDEKFLGGKQFPSTPANSGPPDSLPYDAWPNDENYTYDNPAKAYDGVLPPTDAQREKAGTNYRKWQRAYNKSKSPADKVMEIYARYNSQYDKKTGFKEFQRFLDVRYVGNHGNPPPRGEAFEARMVKKYNMVGPDWWCQDPIDYKDPPETGEKRTRVVDAHNRRTERKVEMKSNGKIEDDQLKADRQIAKEKPKSTFRYLTGGEDGGVHEAEDRAVRRGPEEGPGAPAAPRPGSTSGGRTRSSAPRSRTSTRGSTSASTPIRSRAAVRDRSSTRPCGPGRPPRRPAGSRRSTTGTTAAGTSAGGARRHRLLHPGDQLRRYARQGQGPRLLDEGRLRRGPGHRSGGVRR
ncbi:hypothetical protein GTV15_08165 [Streptomyces sp. SID7803]|nr:hypothetical protein [Streptomyces sp. SID7803]